MFILARVLKEYLSINCKQATFLASQSLDDKLSLDAKLKLKWHLLICTNCTLYLKQIKYIRIIARSQKESISKLPEEARLRITQAVLEVEKSIRNKHN